jgi:hypothetical protein
MNSKKTYYYANIDKEKVLRFISDLDVHVPEYVKQVNIRVFNLNDYYNFDEYFVKFSGTLLRSHYIDILKEIPKCNLGLLAAKALARYLDTGENTDKTLEIHTGNWNDFFKIRDDNSETIEGKCAQCFVLFERENPEDLSGLSAYDIFISLPYDWDQIIKAIQNLSINIGLLESKDDLRYVIKDGRFEEMKELASKLKEPDHVTKNKYYSIVPIQTTGDFVFVLMPFGNEGLNLYYNIIKNKIENNKNWVLSCYRSDEDIISGRIENKIYTYIYNAKLIIAELTENNLNVYYELGMMHTLNKEVLIITQNKPEELPFDISHLNAYHYSNEQELEQIIEDFISAHLK